MNRPLRFPFLLSLWAISCLGTGSSLAREPLAPAPVPIIQIPTATPLPAELTAMVELIRERLSWMDEVAEVKRAKGSPVADPQREQALLAAMEKQAVTAGLPPAAVRRLFEGQIEAAKVFQTEWLARPKPSDWETRPLPDLGKDVRPALDALGQRMIDALVKLRLAGVSKAQVRAAEPMLSKAGFSSAVIQPALAGLAAALE